MKEGQLAWTRSPDTNAIAANDVRIASALRATCPAADQHPQGRICRSEP